MQSLAVAVIVACAALFAGWRLMPRAWRVQLAAALAAGIRRHARISDDEAAALARRLAQGGCGGCDSCGACEPAKPAVVHMPSATRSPRAPA